MYASAYHLAPDYVLWGVSWANLRLMVEDTMRTDYKSKSGENSSQPAAGDVIDMNDPKAIEKLRQMCR